MKRYSQLHELMAERLPKLSYQKRLHYRTNTKEVRKLFDLLNLEIFDNKLPTPKFEVRARCRQYWGICIAEDCNVETTSSECLIRLSDKWFCRQWLITTLAHEMCHQYQWDILGKKRMKKGLEPIMSHGPSFFKFRDKLARYGIPLKKAHRRRPWFEHQNLNKC